MKNLQFVDEHACCIILNTQTTSTVIKISDNVSVEDQSYLQVRE